MRNLRSLSLLALLAAAGPAPSAVAQDRNPSTDQQIQAAVVRTLQDHRLRRGTDPQVVAVDGTVTLSGQVQSVWEKDEAIKLARGVNGVKTLVSDLTIARAESDKKIAERFGDRVRHYSRYSIFDDINGVVRDGVVALDGFVTGPEKIGEVVDIASRIQGVQDVKSRLQAYPVSQSDDGLRNEIARRIFRNPDLDHYARQANPSIHIIVIHGHVVLKGFVDSALDNQVITSLVRGVPGVMQLDNQLQAGR